MKILTDKQLEKLCKGCPGECVGGCDKQLEAQAAMTELETLRQIDDMIFGTTAPFEKRMSEGSIMLDINPVDWHTKLEQAQSRCRELGLL